MDPCAGLHILAHGSIPLPYLPNLCAVLRPAPLASYYFPFLSFPLLSPCIGLSLDGEFGGRVSCHKPFGRWLGAVKVLFQLVDGEFRGRGLISCQYKPIDMWRDAVDISF